MRECTRTRNVIDEFGKRKLVVLGTATAAESSTNWMCVCDGERQRERVGTSVVIFSV